MAPDTELLTIPATEIKIGDTLLVFSGTPDPRPRVVLLVEGEVSWSPDVMSVQQHHNITHTLLMKDDQVIVRRPVTDAGIKELVNRLLGYWRDADFAAEYIGKDYTSTKECRQLTNTIAVLEQGEPTTTATYDDYVMHIRERAWEGVDERHFIIPN